MAEELLAGGVRLFHGDSREVLKGIPDNSIDSCVCDPPYALVSIVKRFGGENAAPARDGDVYARASAGFMGKKWDTGETAFAAEFWAEVMRVLKPGAHIIAFSGTRTYHRLACAVEDAGFEIRDMLQWLYGSGFPKSHDVASDIARLLGEDAAEVGEWEGWGTALKPACEPIVFGRKPVAGTIARNVLIHRTGGIHIAACRIEAEKPTGWGGKGAGGNTWNEGNCGLTEDGEARPVDGRWPANVLHDGSDEVLSCFPDAPGQQYAVTPEHAQKTGTAVYGDFGPRPLTLPRGDTGSAARFFYSAKADAMDRVGSEHPTVKRLDLMQYLCRLVTPPGGVVLDPFAGSGTTGEAAYREGFGCILIEREAEYAEDIRQRMSLAASGEKTRRRAIAARKAKPDDALGGLFATGGN